MTVEIRGMGALNERLTKASKSGPDFQEIGASGLNYAYDGTVQEELHPNLTGRKALETWRAMKENDALVGAILYAIDMLVRQVDWRVDERGAKRKDAEFLESAMHDMSQSFSSFISEILTMLPYGFAFHEIVYKRREGIKGKHYSKYDDGKIGWRKLPIRAQDTLDHWEFDEEGGVTTFVQRVPPDFREARIPLEKGLLFRTSSHKNNPEGVSLLRSAYNSWYIKKRLQALEGTGIERDLAGFPVFWLPAEYLSADATPEQKQVLHAFETIGQNVRRDKQEYIIMPLAYTDEGHKAYDFSLMSGGGSRTYDTSQIIERYNQEIAMSMLSDFILLGHESVGSFALAQPYDSRVLTPYGFVSMGDLEVGDELADPFGQESFVEQIHEHGEKEVYQVYFAGGEVVETSGDHKWAVTTYNWSHSVLQAEHPYEPLDDFWVMTTEEIMQQTNKLYIYTPAYFPPDDYDRIPNYDHIVEVVKTDTKKTMRCITVSADSHLYVTDGYIVTHNSSNKTDLFATSLGTILNEIADVLNRFAVPRLFKVNGLDTKELPAIVHADVEKPDLMQLGQYLTNLANVGMTLFPDQDLEGYLRDAASLPEKSAETIKEQEALKQQQTDALQQAGGDAPAQEGEEAAPVEGEEPQDPDTVEFAETGGEETRNTLSREELAKEREANKLFNEIMDWTTDELQPEDEEVLETTENIEAGGVEVPVENPEDELDESGTIETEEDSGDEESK